MPSSRRRPARQQRCHVKVEKIFLDFTNLQLTEPAMVECGARLSPEGNCPRHYPSGAERPSSEQRAIYAARNKAEALERKARSLARRAARQVANSDQT